MVRLVSEMAFYQVTRRLARLISEYGEEPRPHWTQEQSLHSWEPSGRWSPAFSRSWNALARSASKTAASILLMTGFYANGLNQIKSVVDARERPLLLLLKPSLWQHFKFRNRQIQFIVNCLFNEVDRNFLGEPVGFIIGDCNLIRRSLICSFDQEAIF
jgi:hypothetical protein